MANICLDLSTVYQANLRIANIGIRGIHALQRMSILNLTLTRPTGLCAIKIDMATRIKEISSLLERKEHLDETRLAD
jgi:hypothetical protein